MYEIRQIKCLLADIDYKLVHAFREDNKAADRLANLGCQRKFVCAYGGEEVSQKVERH